LLDGVTELLFILDDSHLQLRKDLRRLNEILERPATR
jgi:hypothetical protein